MFLDILAETATHQCGLTSSEPILVGVSGGADSLALMLGLETLGFNLVIAHLDHGLRPESASEADFVRNLAETRGMQFVQKRIDVLSVAKNEGQSIEEAARNVRYEFLFEQANLHHAQAVAVAHHADDQVETVLMHFLRGAALPGLSGMSYRRIFPLWDEHIPLVRPLLGIWREEVEAFVNQAGLKPQLDLSNQDTTFFRNRLRHVLIPELETYNQQFRKILWRMAEVLGEEEVFLKDLTQDAWEAYFRAQTGDRVELDYRSFTHLHKAMQRRILRQAISLLRPDLRDVGFDIIQEGLAFADEPPESREIDLVARLNLALVEDILVIKTWEAELPDFGIPLLMAPNAQEILDSDHPVRLRHGWQLVADLAPEVPGTIRTHLKEMDPNEAWLDVDRLTLPLIVRGRKPGERWQPIGMTDHTKSLQDFFINEKIPKHLRDIWPLVCSDDEIAWVVGLRPSEPFKVTHHTRRLLHLKVVQVE